MLSSYLKFPFLLKLINFNFPVTMICFILFLFVLLPCLGIPKKDALISQSYAIGSVFCVTILLLLIIPINTRLLFTFIVVAFFSYSDGRNKRY